MVPALVSGAGRRASKRFVEFFTAQIRNPNTRQAYARAAARFSAWCEERGMGLLDLEPVAAAAYVETLIKEGLAVPTVKQHLSALRNLCDWLVTGQVLPFNPFAPVRAPRYVVTTGKTPTLDEHDARELLDSIDTTHVVGLRDRAIIASMVYSFARVGAIVQLRVRDYESHGRKASLALKEKGGKFNRVPVHHKAAEALDAYLDAAELGGGRNGPLFRSARGRCRTELTPRAMARHDVLRMVKRRAKDAGLPKDAVCNHTFRASGITNYMENGGSLEVAAQIAGHSSTRTTQLYNRHRDRIAQDEIERIRI